MEQLSLPEYQTSSIIFNKDQVSALLESDKLHNTYSFRFSEELVTRRILEQHLNREITNEDSQLCTRVFTNGEEHKYTLCYDGLPLGVVILYNIFTPFTKSY